MNSTIWTVFSLILILEGIGPALFPKFWRKIMNSLTILPDLLLRRLGGVLIVAGYIICYILSKK